MNLQHSIICEQDSALVCPNTIQAPLHARCTVLCLQSTYVRSASGTLEIGPQKRRISEQRVW